MDTAKQSYGRTRDQIAKEVKQGAMIQKQELAKLYQVSWETIRNWIYRHPELAKHQTALLSQKNLLSPAQYRTLFKYLGEPFENDL